MTTASGSQAMVIHRIHTYPAYGGPGPVTGGLGDDSGDIGNPTTLSSSSEGKGLKIEIGSLHESFVHSRSKTFNRADGAKRRPLVTSRSRPQRACRCPRRAERAALASWATPEHASSMASSTTSGNLTVYEHEEGDAGTMQKVSAM